MPIATPEVYAEMLDRAKERASPTRRSTCTSSQTLNAALQGFAEAGSDGIIQVSTGGAEFLSGPTVKDMVTGAVALAEFAHVVAEKYPITSRCTPTTAPRTSWTATSARCSRSRRSGWHERREAAVPVAHVGRLGRAARREPGRSPQELLDAGAPRPRSSWRSRSAWSAARRTASSARSTRSSTPRPRTAMTTVEALGLGRAAAATCSPRPSATCTACTSRATSSCAPTILKEVQEAVGAKFGRGASRSTWSSTAARARCRRRSGRRSTTAWSR